MKQKKSQYLLLILAIAVWGIIIYRVFNQMQDRSDMNTVVKSRTVIDSLRNTSEKFDIVFNDVNPFVETTGNELDQDVSNEDRQSDISEYIQPAQIIWPSIEYSGVVIAKKDPDKKRVLIKIDNNEHILNLGQEISGVKLLRVYKDSAIFSYKSEIKTYKKNEYN